MKKVLVLVLLVALCSPCAFAQYGQKTEANDVILETEDIRVFPVYADKWSEDNHFAPSGWMGDYGDIRINDNYRQDTHSGKSCIQVKYSAEGSNGAGWMGVYWQNPPNNWGDQMGGYDLSNHKKLTFWAKGENGGEVIAEFKLGGIGGMYSDSDSMSIGPITLTKNWKEYTINLKDIDLSYISGGFCLSARASENPKGFTIYLDDIKYSE